MLAMDMNCQQSIEAHKRQEWPWIEYAESENPQVWWAEL